MTGRPLKWTFVRTAPGVFTVKDETAVEIGTVTRDFKGVWRYESPSALLCRRQGYTTRIDCTRALQEARHRGDAP